MSLGRLSRWCAAIPLRTAGQGLLFLFAVCIGCGGKVVVTEAGSAPSDAGTGSATGTNSGGSTETGMGASAGGGTSVYDDCWTHGLEECQTCCMGTFGKAQQVWQEHFEELCMCAAEAPCSADCLAWCDDESLTTDCAICAEGNHLCRTDVDALCDSDASCAPFVECRDGCSAES